MIAYSTAIRYRTRILPLMRTPDLPRLAVLSLAVATTSLVRAQVIDPDKTGGPPLYKLAPAGAPVGSRYTRSIEPQIGSTKSRNNSSSKNSSSAETTPHSSPAHSPSAASSPSPSPSPRASTSPTPNASASAAKKASKKAKSIDPDKTGGSAQSEPGG